MQDLTAQMKYYEEITRETSEQLKERGWKEITAEEADYFLGCLPPARMKDNAFMVGECVTHGIAGAIYTAVVTVSGRHFTRDAPKHEFNPKAYTAEVQKQFNL